MIKISVNKASINNLYKELGLKKSGIESLITPGVINEFAKAAFVVTGERFMLAADRHAVANPKAMHHVYEWDMIGRPTARLFVLNRARVIYGNVTIDASFIPSKVPVPIPAELMNSGKSITSRHVFRDKAKIIEEGKPVRFQARRVLTFLADGEQVFVAPGTMINIMNPGGIAAKNSFSKFMHEWYMKNAQVVIDSSGIYNRIVKESAAVLSRKNTGPAEVKAIAAQVANGIGGRTMVIK